MSLLHHHILALALTAVTTSALGLLVLAAGRSRRLNQIFALYSLAIAWWGVTEAFVVGAPDPATADAWSSLEWIGVIFIAPTFLHTVLLSLEEKGRRATSLLAAAYGLSVLLLIFHLGFDLIGRPPRPVGYAPFHNQVTPLGIAVPAVFFLFCTLGLWKLKRAVRRTTGRRRTQLRYLFWGSLIGYLGGSPDWCMVFGMSIPGLNPFGIYGVSLYSVAITYAALQHRLFDVNLVIRRSLVYSALVTLLTVGYLGLIYLAERLFQTTLGYRSLGISVAAFALMALACQPLKDAIQRLVDRLILQTSREDLVRRMERFEQEAVWSEKLKSVATLAAGMAHEIKNPLAAIKTFTDYLPRHFGDPVFREKFVRIVSHEVEKINTLVQRLLDFAKPATPKIQPVEVGPLVQDTVEFLHPMLLDRRIRVQSRCAPAGLVLADPSQLRQVLLNVLLNSLEAMETGGVVRIGAERRNGHVTVAVSDTGPGIPKADLARVFDPFFTTKPQGTGLGLSVVHRIVSEHQGRVRILSEPGQGTTVEIKLPAALSQ